MDQLKRLISSYEDFPKKGIVFRDVLEILQDPIIFNELIKNMSNVDFLLNSDAIISIDARGFIFGSAISLQTLKPLIFARKPGKLPVNWSLIVMNLNMAKILYRYKKSV